MGQSEAVQAVDCGEKFGNPPLSTLIQRIRPSGPVGECRFQMKISLLV
jgi:hypothetical protein